MPRPQVPLKQIKADHAQKILNKAQEADDSIVGLVIFRSTGRAIFVGDEDPVGAEGETHDETNKLAQPAGLMVYPRGNRW